MWDCELLEHVRVNDAIDRFLNEERRSSISTRISGTQFVRHDDTLYQCVEYCCNGLHDEFQA